MAEGAGGALLPTAASCELDYDFVRKPSGPAETRVVNHLRLGEALFELNDSPIRALFIAVNNPAVKCCAAPAEPPQLSILSRYAQPGRCGWLPRSLSGSAHRQGSRNSIRKPSPRRVCPWCRASAPMAKR